MYVQLNLEECIESFYPTKNYLFTVCCNYFSSSGNHLIKLHSFRMSFYSLWRPGQCTGNGSGYQLRVQTPAYVYYNVQVSVESISIFFESVLNVNCVSNVTLLSIFYPNVTYTSSTLNLCIEKI